MIRCVRVQALAACWLWLCACGSGLCQGGRETTGTAFVVSPDGYLLTCAHVVEDCTSVTVVLGDDRHEATLLSADDENDVAVLHIEATGLAALPLANSDAVEIGQDVRVFGFPLAGQLGDTVKATSGTLSGIQMRDARKILQVDAPVNPGNSGGPLVDGHGAVVGVVSAKISRHDVSNVAFVVPINYAKALLRDEGVAFSDGDATAEPRGPELVRQVSPAVALVRVVRRAADAEDSPELLSTLEGHASGVQAMAFSSDGKLLATGGHDQSVRVWNLATEALVHTLHSHGSCVHAVAFSPDGSRLAGGSPDGTVKLWDPRAGELLHTLRGHSTVADLLAFSPDGDTIATASTNADDLAVRLWLVETGDQLSVLTGHTDALTSVAFSPDGAMLATCSRDKTIKLWDVSGLGE